MPKITKLLRAGFCGRYQVRDSAYRELEWTNVRISCLLAFWLPGQGAYILGIAPKLYAYQAS